MKFIKKILTIASALFIQFTSLTTAMDVSLHCKIFEQQDIMGCIVKHFGKETPFTDFWNYCSTNKKNYENYKDDANIFKQIALQSKYLNHDLQFLNPNNIASYRMLLACVEKELPELMRISRDMDIDYSNFMINYETSLDMYEVYKTLVKIRTIEKKFTPDSCPLDPSSIFSLDTRKIIWGAEGATMAYLDRFNHEYSCIQDVFHLSAPSDVTREVIDIYYKNRFSPGDNLAFKYVSILFPLLDRGTYFDELHSLKIFELYWFTMLAREFFQIHPEISLIFSLSLGSKYKISLNLKDKDKPFDYAYEEFFKRYEVSALISSYIEKNHNIMLNLKNKVKSLYYQDKEYEELRERKDIYFFNERHFIDKNVFKKRKEYLEFALPEIPEAWDLYQKVLEYENYPKEIMGIEKPEVVAQLPN